MSKEQSLQSAESASSVEPADLDLELEFPTFEMPLEAPEPINSGPIWDQSQEVSIQTEEPEPQMPSSNGNPQVEGIAFSEERGDYKKELAPKQESDPYKPKGIFGSFKKSKGVEEPEQEAADQSVPPIHQMDETSLNSEPTSTNEELEAISASPDIKADDSDNPTNGWVDDPAARQELNQASEHSTPQGLENPLAEDQSFTSHLGNPLQDDEPTSPLPWQSFGATEELSPMEEIAPESQNNKTVPDVFKRAMGVETQEPVPPASWSQDAPSLNGESELENSPNGELESDIPEEYRQLEDTEVAKAKDKKLGDLLIDNSIITQKQLLRALGRQGETKEKLGQILIALQMISEQRLLQVLAAQKSANAWHLESDAPQEEAVNLVPEEVCRIFQVLPVAVRDDHLVLAMRDATDFEALEAARQHSKRKIEPVMADEVRLAFKIDKIFGETESRRIAASDVMIQEAMEAVLSDDYGVSELDKTVAMDAVIDAILASGVQARATDIHIEPAHDKTIVRLRVDGDLSNSQEIPLELTSFITKRLKVRAEIPSMDDTFPSEGLILTKVIGREIELKVNFNSGIHGVRTAIRVMDRTTGLRSLDDLGFDEENLNILKELIQKPYGLLLVTGPATSGKTTTLYSILQILKSANKNITTCEDPIEYDLYGVNQTQVNRKVGIEMAAQFRALLRQDSDIVMIGEIRDKETLDLAIRASITGHLVITSVHATDATSAIASLLDMGADPQLLGAALIGVTNQRLVKKLCPDCRSQSETTTEEAGLLSNEFSADTLSELWKAEGCESCGSTGSAGRTLLTEVLPVTHEVKRMIAQRATLEDVAEAAAYYGYLPIKQDALSKIANGEVRLDDALSHLEFETMPRSDSPRQAKVS